MMSVEDVQGAMQCGAAQWLGHEEKKAAPWWHVRAEKLWYSLTYPQE